LPNDDILKVNNISDKDNTEVFTSYHHSQFDSDLLNKAIDKAVNDKEFIISSLNLIKDLEFPTYKYKLINHAEN